MGGGRWEIVYAVTSGGKKKVLDISVMATLMEGPVGG